MRRSERRSGDSARASPFLFVSLAATALLAADPALAQLPIPASSQFDITGFIEVATLDPSCATNPHCGGTLVVNGHTITVPKETIVILPANALTWQEVFAQAPAPYGLAAGTSGLAITDAPAPLTTFEAQVVGNRVTGAPGGDQYIAGLVYISQQGLNTGSGFINFIDYSVGEMWVGGALGTQAGTRVRINDPAGRYGRQNSPDPRFTVDADNPTITSGTGFPMCLPRVAPPAPGGVETDPLCPQAQRPISVAGNPPVYASVIQTNDPVTLPGVPPDAAVQIPFEVGDYITFSGTLVHDGTNPTAGPMPPNVPGGTYIAAHTIENNIAVFTWPGSNPAYVRTDVTLMGTGGLTVIGAGEAAIRTRFEGMSTDPTRNVHLYGIDVAADGSISDRSWGTIGVDPGPPTGAVKGRWRFRPPCTAAVASDKACTPPSGGTFLPPTREVRAVIEGAWVPGQTATFANGLIAGQYHAPILEYIFPENVPGSPVVPNNFNTIPFLAQGGYASSTGVIAGQLNPWPDATVPTPACTPPTANAGGPYTVASGGTVTLGASALGTAPFTFAWAAPTAGSLSALNVSSPVYTAPVGAQTVSLTLVVTNACGTSNASTSVTVNAAAAPTVAHVAALSLASGAAGSFTISATDPGGLAVTFTVAQAGAPALSNLTVGAVTCTSGAPSTCTARVTFTAPILPLGQVTPSVVTLTTTARNTGGATSAPDTTTVTVNPLADALVITATEYRTGKQRLTVNATSSIISPNVVVTLRPYLTATGTTFDPSVLGNTLTNNGGGLYILTLVGAPEPAVPPATSLVVQSNLGGVSPPHGLDRIRQ